MRKKLTRSPAKIIHHIRWQAFERLTRPHIQTWKVIFKSFRVGYTDPQYFRGGISSSLPSGANPCTTAIDFSPPSLTLSISLSLSLSPQTFLPFHLQTGTIYTISSFLLRMPQARFEILYDCWICICLVPCLDNAPLPCRPTEDEPHAHTASYRRHPCLR